MTVVTVSKESEVLEKLPCHAVCERSHRISQGDMRTLRCGLFDMAWQETRRRINDCCIPLRGGSAVVHVGSLSLGHWVVMLLSPPVFFPVVTSQNVMLYNQSTTQPS